MGGLFTTLFAKIAAVVQWFGQLAVAVFTALWDLLRDAACWPFDQVTDIAVSAVSALDLTGLSQYTSSWGSLPAELINVMGLVGVGHAAAIVISAITIRVVLQLIPFTRLGS